MGPLQGEFQVTNGYGRDKASSDDDVEDDFKFMSKNGLTTTRILVGWKYNLKIIIDLHAKHRAQRMADASRPERYAIELINEPLALEVTLDTLKRYYKAGYDVVCKYTDAYVIMSNRLSISDPIELVQFAIRFTRFVIDVHYYNLFSSIVDGMTMQ
ncbi:hypothetical protein HPP92_006296 [Vanilla planifolia]|uniref:Mannan endo-1,4-beta-mannosidase n=1 Tax=Vanilla planifolia TaxID=51239 RepID=A0A835RLT5_VANPL|nr:hypothetical protein HPP92_006296 [Vanilla planifolia]